MAREDVARQPIRLRQRRRRTLEERLLLRMPTLIRLGGLLLRRLPLRSRLRRWMVRHRVRQVFEALNRDDMEVGVVLGNDPEVVFHPGDDVLGVGWEDVYHGHQGMHAVFQELRTAFDRGMYETEEIIDCGDKLVLRARFVVRGTRSGVMVEQPVTQVHTLGPDGRAVRTDNYWGDNTAALKTAGLRE